MTVVVTPLEFLEAVYSNENLPLTVRMRAAIEAAPYKHHKLTAMSVAHYGPNFAAELDRAIARSNGPLLLNPPKVIEATVVNGQEPTKPYQRINGRSSSYRRC